MKKINKKKIAVVILLFLMVIIELIALGLSRAEQTKEITLIIIDSQKAVDDFELAITVYDGGESGYYITLPETINNRKVKNYLVVKKNIEANENNQTENSDENVSNTTVENAVVEDTTNTIEDNTIQESLNDTVENNAINENVENNTENQVTEEESNVETIVVKMQAGERVYLTQTELEMAKMTIEVEYAEDNSQEEEINIVDIATEQLPQLFASNSPLSVDTDTSWDGNTAMGFNVGNGTQANPYLISTGDELSYLANQVNSGTTYEGIYFQIAADIDLNGKDWKPIGTASNSFRGIIDGAGHTIANAVIKITNTNNNVETYGIFGTIGGGTQETIIKNMSFNNIVVAFNVTRSISSNSYGYKIGIVTGAMYNNSKIQNTSVKNSQINHDGLITAQYNQGWNNTTYYAPILFVGGIAGDAVYSESNENTTGTSGIDYCYSDVDISLNVTTGSTGWGGWGTSSSTPILCLGQVNIGGIIGRIKSQNTWPANSLYTGTITASNTNYANGLVGPIFGADRDNTGYNSTTNMNTIWNGDNRNSYTMSSYYNSYNVYGTTFTSTVTSGNAGTNTQYRRSTNSSNIGYVQGVNKGTYTNNISSRLNTFNQSNQNVTWEYKNNELGLIPRITATATETADNVCTIDIDDPYNTGSYTYTWYVNGEKDETLTGTTGPTIEPSFETEYDIKVVVYDGTYYAVATYYIPRLTIDIEFDVNNTNQSVTATLTGTALQYANLDDYTYQWYMLDIAGDETKLEGKTSLTLTDLQNAMEYKLVATNNSNSKLSTEGSFVFGTRTVIYVDYNNGSDYNDGYTPETPVESMSTAYSKLKSNGTRNENVIVIMGTNSEYNFFNSQTSTTYAKNATITGKYAGVDYNARWTFGSSSSYFRYLTADLTIMNMTLNGNNGSMYLICQGHSFTIGENVIMDNYATASANQGLLGGNAPAFHVFAGWYQYNRTRLPNNDCEIIIKSGTYGRIILGGTPGTSSGQGQTTSHDFMGSSMEDSFRVSIKVDIKNSTTPEEYDYDINLLVGGSASGNNYSIVTENIENGSVGRVLGGSIGDSASRPNRMVIP